MSVAFPGLRVVTCWSFLAILTVGCRSTPVGAPGEEEDLEAQIERTEMFSHRARLEPKTGLRFPINGEIDVATPADMATGIKGSIEAVDRGIWFGMEFDYTLFQSKNPLSALDSLESITAVQNAKTEGMISEFDRYDLLFTFDYDVELGSHVPGIDGGGFDFYSPIFSFGIGLGAAIINASESDGNPLTKFNNQYAFLARPTVAFRFPFHENFGALVEANYDFIPKVTMDGSFSPTDEKVEIGSNDVEFSTLNVWFGLMFSW